MHRLLRRQIKQVYGKSYNIDNLDENMLTLLSNVTETYKNFDEEKSFLNQTILENRKVIKEAYENMLTRSRLAAIGEMMENITHQWKQPLSVILNIVTIMKLETPANRDLQVIEEQTRYLDNTIKDFTNFSSHDKEEENFFSIKKSISETLHIFDYQARKHAIEIQMDLEENLYTQGDIGKFNQALLVIFSNAKDALISNEVEERLISVKTRSLETAIEIKIEDNAGGIQEDVIEKIFEPYFTTKFKDKGTGIGLSMTYNIVQSMSGEIHAKNSDNGAQFSIYLPKKNFKKESSE